MAPIHPGKILLEEFLEPLGISQNRLALAAGIPAPRINAIVKGKRGITADTALRIGRFFGTGPEFWMNLQSRYDLEVQRDQLGERLIQEVHPLAVAG
ncbi:MAG TPA: HigA family addiction module antitoxin [Pantanalinema sp.]